MLKYLLEGAEETTGIKDAPDSWGCSMLTSYGSNINILEQVELNTLSTLIMQEVLKYVEFVDREHIGAHTLKLDNSFFNIGGKGSYQEFHTHLPSNVSFVYYVQALPEQGNIVFNGFNPPSLPWAYHGVDVPPITGRLVIFPSHTPHQVIRNRTEGLRVSIAGNCTAALEQPWDIDPTTLF